MNTFWYLNYKAVVLVREYIFLYKDFIAISLPFLETSDE